MVALVVFILLAITIVILIEIRERKRQSDNSDNNTTPATQRPEGCCGEHLVCEKETLLNTNMQIEYFDDEELDQYAGRDAESYNDAEIAVFNDIFTTLKEEEVASWCRSLQMRNISLPLNIREEALMIVRERRNMS